MDGETEIEEGVLAEMGTSDQDEENSESLKATEEDPAEEEKSGNEFPVVTTSEDLDMKMHEVNEQPVSHEESVEINSNDDDGLPALQLETPERQNTSPTQEEDEAEEDESPAAPADKEDINYEEYMQLHQQLCGDKDKANQQHSMLQMKLAEYFCKKAVDTEIWVSELQPYEKYIKILTDLKLTVDSQTAQQQTEELGFKTHEKLDKAENGWQVALKQDVVVTILSRRLGKEAAQAKVDARLATEKVLQHELIKARLKHSKLRRRTQRLEAKLREGEENAQDPQQLKFEQLFAIKLELKKHTEKQNNESLKMQKKIISSLELLSNIKEKLFWSQMQVQAKREQLAKVEAMVAKKKDILTRTRQARNSLKRDNPRLKEHRGLLGNRVLLRDFEDTVDASDHLEEQLEDLKCQIYTLNL